MSGPSSPRPPDFDELLAAARERVFALDGSAYFSRPGPRVIDGIELLAEIFDPDAFVTSRRSGRGRRSTPRPRHRRCPFARASIACGAGPRHTCRGPDDLEGWAQLCPDCVGKAGDNGFLRFRLRQALTERGAARAGSVAVAEDDRCERRAADRGHDRGRCAGTRPVADPPTAIVEYYEARAPEYDDWYLRRGRYARGPVHDAAWNAELDAAGRWLDAQPIRGEIVELAAGTGWWSPLLATQGRALDLRRVAVGARSCPRAPRRPRPAGAHPRPRRVGRSRPTRSTRVFAGFWLSHVPRDRLAAFLGVVRRWLKPGGTFAFIDSLEDPQSSAVGPPDARRRSLRSGGSTTAASSPIVKVYYTPAELEAALAAAGFATADVTTTGRFFLTAWSQLPRPTR